MPFHPSPVRWFEAKIPRHQTVYALELLAESGSVELEAQGIEHFPCVDEGILRGRLIAFDKLAKRYASDLPSYETETEQHIRNPERVAETALVCLQKWVGDFLGAKRRHRQIENDLHLLDLLGECLDAMGEDARGMDAFGFTTRFLYKQAFACPKGLIKETMLDNDVLEQLYQGEHHDFLILVGNRDRQAVLEGAAALLKCAPVALPDWLPQAPSDQTRLLAEHKASLTRESGGLEETLVALRQDAEVASALKDMRLLRWYLTTFIERTGDRRACQITGWTTASTPGELTTLLAAGGIQAEVIFSPPRMDLKPPVTLSGARWSAPFSIFLRMMGVPGKDEVDPTPVLSFIVPLLFGFMFPDLGHGLVLAAVGALMAKRHPSAVILVPCGFAAAGFGLVFGEFFGIHGLFPSPCGCPLDNPMNILIATLILGVGLILLGLVFSGIEAWWRGNGTRWLVEEAPVIALYLSGVLILVWRDFWIVSVGALTWYLFGAIVLCRAPVTGCFFRQVGRLLDSTLQLALATISFLRVGAFALAHGAFSVVILELVRQIDSPVLQGLAFIVGHIFVIAVEGLIVMIQTTRLVLFEFFARFLSFEGRIYKPLQKPGARDAPSPLN